MFLISFSIILVLVLSIFLMTATWKKVPQDKALVITGFRKKRVISGGGGFVIPLLERADAISLETINIDVRTGGALTSQGVSIIMDGVSLIKISAEEQAILDAMQQFNTGNIKSTIEIIRQTAKDVLEGKLREIISKLTVEEIYKDREKFATAVQETATVELANLGLELKSFTIRDISDNNGYLEALGKRRIAEVKRDAEISEADAIRETEIKVAEAKRDTDIQRAEARRLGREAEIVAETQIAEAEKEKQVKIEDYRKEQELVKADADIAYRLQDSKRSQELAREQGQVTIEEKKKQIELAENEALRREKELDANIRRQADAEKYKAEKAAEADRYTAEQKAEAEKYSRIQDANAEAESIRLKGDADASAERAVGQAHAEIIRITGEAEAEAMNKKAEAWKQYGEAALAHMVIEKLPEIARAVAEPLSKTEKIVIIDSGSNPEGGASKVANYVTDIVASVPEVVESITGINLVDIVKKKDVNK